MGTGSELGTGDASGLAVGLTEGVGGCLRFGEAWTGKACDPFSLGQMNRQVTTCQMTHFGQELAPRAIHGTLADHIFGTRNKINSLEVWKQAADYASRGPCDIADGAFKWSSKPETPYNLVGHDT